MRNWLIRPALVVAAVLALAACNVRGKTATPTYAGQPKSMVVATSLSVEDDAADAALFKTLMAKHLQECGVDSTFVGRQPFYLRDYTTTAYSDQLAVEDAQAYPDADGVIILSEARKNLSSLIKTKLTQEVSREYRARFYDSARKDVVWKTDLLMRSYGLLFPYTPEEKARRIVRSLLAGLVKEGILRGCPANFADAIVD